MTIRKTAKPPSGTWGRIDLLREPLAGAQESSLRQRWKWLCSLPEYVADFDDLRQRFPLHDEYERRGRESFELIGMMSFATHLLKEGYFDRLQEIRVKYGLAGPPPDPRHHYLTLEELRIVFEPTTGLPLEAAEHSDANAAMQWALFTADTATVSDPANQEALDRAGRLPVVSTRNGVAFQVHDGVVWFPITGWDTEQTIQAKRKLARAYLARETGRSRWRGSWRPPASRLRVEVFPDGVVRVPICNVDDAAAVAKRIEDARELVRERTGWERPPRVNPWESTKVARLMSDGSSGRNALAGAGVGPEDAEIEPTSEQLAARVHELERSGLSPDAARVAALNELVKYTPDRLVQSRERSRARRRRGRRLP